jgi:organic radical activating enzyme
MVSDTTEKEAAACNPILAHPARMLYLQLTYRCNLRCKFCASESTNSPDTYDYQVENYEELFANNLDCDLIHITGGEPSLCANLVSLCNHARVCFKRVLLSTNAIRCFNREYAQELLNTSPDYIVVPSFTSREDLYDSLVQTRGAFQKYVAGLQNLTHYNNAAYSKILVKIIPIRSAIDLIADLPEFWSKQNIFPDEVQISGLHLGANVMQHQDLITDTHTLSLNISTLVQNLYLAQIPFSISDLPWCLLKDDALALLLGHGILRPTIDAMEYTKVYAKGKRRGAVQNYRFEQCRVCEISALCNGCDMTNIHVIEHDLKPALRAIKFV